MACNICDHTMQKITSPDNVFWCPRCGNLKMDQGQGTITSTPLLVERTRSLIVEHLEDEALTAAFGLGVTESVFVVVPEEYQ